MLSENYIKSIKEISHIAVISVHHKKIVNGLTLNFSMQVSALWSMCTNYIEYGNYIFPKYKIV